ncbi:MAG: hypothetical protein Q8P20_11010 [bacterium]|nr:hypothetical protein [bacterium]
MPIKNSQEKLRPMANYSFDFDKLLIFDHNKSRSTCHVFVSNQSPVEEKNLGKLVLLAEITSNDRINLDIINTIQEEIKTSYYNTDDLQIEAALEKALEQANQRIADMVGDYDTNWLDKLNIVVAVLKDNNLHFAHIGRLYVFLTRNNKITNIIESTESADAFAEPINPLKAFSNIISGDLESDDRLFFCTASLLDYLSQEKIKKTIQDNQPNRAIELMEGLLAENSANTAFCALALKINEELQSTTQSQAYNQSIVNEVSGQPTVVRPQYNTPLEHFTDSQSSMERLQEKKDMANQVLAPSMGKYLKKLFVNALSGISDFVKLKLMKQSPRRLRFEKEVKDYRPAQTSKTETKQSFRQKPRGQGFIKVLKSIGSFIGSLLLSIFSLFKKSDQIINKVVSTPKTFSQKVTNVINRFIKLPVLSKFLLLAAIVVAFFLAQNVFTSVLSQQTQEESIKFDQTIPLVSQNILKAEAALSYDNEDGAKELLTEAKNMLNELPQKEEFQKNKINELFNDINTILEKTRRIANMATNQIANFSSVDESVNISSIIKINDQIFGFDRSKKTIYRADIDSGEIDSFELSNLENTFQYSAPYGDNIILFNSANGLDEFDSDSNSAEAINFSLPIDDVNISNITTYENRIYLIDINNSQILRASRITGGYGQAIEWLEDDTDLSNSVSLAVDGNVYVLNNNGQAYRLFQGVQQTWDLSIIDPALNNANKLITDTAIDNLFILDSQGKRIVEFTKEGQLINQYMSEGFSDLRDMAIDWKNKTTYILNGNNIVSIDIL